MGETIFPQNEQTFPASKNAVSDHLIEAGLRSNGKIWVRGLFSGNYRKPHYRHGAWYVRDHGWRKLLSWEFVADLIRFRVDGFVSYAASCQITHDGGDRPAWINDALHKVCDQTYKDGKRGLWMDVVTFYVEARCAEDIPPQYRKNA